MNASGRPGPGPGLTRRVLLLGLPASSLWAKEPERPRFSSERNDFVDAATEFPVTRLTSPAFSSGLCAGAGSRNRDVVYYWSERTGTAQVFRMDLKTGESVQMTSAEALDGDTATLLPGDRGVCYRDGSWLYLADLTQFRQRRVYTIPEGWLPLAGFAPSADGQRIVFSERRGAVHRLRLLSLAAGAASTILEADTPLAGPLLRERPSGVLYRKGNDGLWLAGLDGRANRALRIAPGGLGPYYWAPDGTSAIYLNFPAERRSLNAIRQIQPESGAEQLLAATSQFASFSPNRDASVFVGASASKASPYLLLLSRATRRELTLCEHRSSDAAAVAPRFAPDSQQVFFHSDRDGKQAIYRMQVDKLVEKTDT